MKPIRIVALDLDGTLLDSDKNISERNMSALARCADRGIYVVPTTGRPADGVPGRIKELPGVRYVITTNGGAIVDLNSGEMLMRRTLSNEKALSLLNIIKNYNTMYDPYIDGRGITQASFFARMDDFGLSAAMQEMVRATRDVVPDVIAHVTQTGRDVEKINIFIADLSQREPLRSRLNQEDGIVVTASMSNNLEVNAEDATKGNGLMWLADYLGVDRAATMSFGDGENDVSMIKMAGVGVAMGNALDMVKACADHVTLTNDEDGVAEAIETLIF